MSISSLTNAAIARSGQALTPRPRSLTLIPYAGTAHLPSTAMTARLASPVPADEKAAQQASVALVEPTVDVTPIPETSVTAALNSIVTYIPTETLTVYLSLVAIIPEFATRPGVVEGKQVFDASMFAWGFLAVCWLLTPVTVWILYAVKVKTGGGTPPSITAWPRSLWWSIIAATISFSVWALSVPANPFTSLPWYQGWMGGLLAIFTSFALGLVAPLFQPSS